MGRRWAWAKGGPILGLAPLRHSGGVAPLGPAPGFRWVMLKSRGSCPDLTALYALDCQLQAPLGSPVQGTSHTALSQLLLPGRNPKRLLGSAVCSALVTRR